MCEGTLSSCRALSSIGPINQQQHRCNKIVWLSLDYVTRKQRQAVLRVSQVCEGGRIFYTKIDGHIQRAGIEGFTAVMATRNDSPTRLSWRTTTGRGRSCSTCGSAGQGGSLRLDNRSTVCCNNAKTMMAARAGCAEMVCVVQVVRVALEGQT